MKKLRYFVINENVKRNGPRVHHSGIPSYLFLNWEVFIWNE